MTGRLENKVAIVTGAGSRGPGIGNGRATAILFAREGAPVVLVDRVQEWADQTLGMIADEHGEAFVLEADVTQTSECQRIVDEAVKRYATIDILQNNVGIGGSGSVVDVNEDTWDQIMRVNVKNATSRGRIVARVIAIYRNAHSRSKRAHLFAYIVVRHHASSAADAHRPDRFDGHRQSASRAVSQLLR